MTVTDKEQPTILLAPNLCSRIIIQQHQEKYLHFFCYSSIECYIELWTNLSPKKYWIGIPFTQSNNHDYYLKVDTTHLPLDDYEFTLRFAITNDNPKQWCWLGKPNENGIIRIVHHDNTIPYITAPTFAAIPQLKFVAKEHFSMTTTDLWHFKTQKYSSNNTCFSLGRLNHPIHSYIAFIRKGSTWLTPVAGMDNFKDRSSTERWQLFLYQDSDRGNIHLWMVTSQNSTCWLAPNSTSQGDATFNFYYNPESDDAAHLLILSTSKTESFARLIQLALKYYQHSIKKQDDNKTVNTRIDPPILLDRLGFCTWNAFGKDVDMNKVDSALSSLKANQIPVGYLLLDDGWQQVSDSNQQLIGLDACQNKFPGGLEYTIQRLKQDYTFIQYIGVWHTLWGYWNGIDKSFSTNYKDEWCSYQAIKNNNSLEESIGILKNPDVFYYDFYKFLNQVGVDFVKVDNQGSFQDLVTTTDKEKMDLWDKYRQAMVENADRFLKGQVINCMSLTPHILLNPVLSDINSSIFRNSDDFFPNEKESHPWHIYANAINTLWTTHYPAIGDWDMFQSDHPFAEYHATSRAISGGPIYITDLPNRHNTDLIYKLLGQNRHLGYTILRSAQAPQPTFETVFNNPMSNQSLLSLYNVNREQSSFGQNQKRPPCYWIPEYGVCGFWNTGPNIRLGVVTNDIFGIKKTSMAPTIAYVVYGSDQGKLMYLPRQVIGDKKYNNSSSRAITVKVDGFGTSLVSISPIRSLGYLSVACLGLMDKFNGTKAILKTDLVKASNNSSCYYAIYKAWLSHRSASCGFWIGREKSVTKHCHSHLRMIPQRVFMDGTLLNSTKDWSWSAENELLTVNMMNISLDVSSTDYFYIQIDIKLI
ncbi:raffinose synthase or seed imbibition protein Sip1-domain-containing protein [Cokeromyces recurvatus]|uniref:raffinose synthase or seed imbibition protein Sip1-domain-containing protein n=1 Tax=Cokeromyces recurvatus TaxID=90255 RepID=UPI0022204460|nr:raffinose synthase or seed imbibition protein Sip1-domain-containing protein [Cokeromyces recurvatus]KAI7907079.1 raffinose synthase or seed imbibition protein Sip1-domain-containing protein [Cokeromyces recurvatus]